MRHIEKPRLVATAVVVLAVFMSGSLAACSGDSTPGSSSTAVADATATANSADASQPSASASVATPSPAAGRSIPVPAPSGGSIQQVIPAATAGPVTKVDLDKTAALPDKVTITVSKVDPIDTKATTPGEIAGPALAIYVSIHNGSMNNISVDSAIVTLTNSQNVLGQPTTSDPHQPFSGELAPGSTAEGIYVFLMSSNARTGLTLSVEYAPGQAIAQFVGDIS